MQILNVWEQDFSDTINCRFCGAMALKTMLACPRCRAYPLEDMG